jgi:hypothetical protein
MPASRNSISREAARVFVKGACDERVTARIIVKHPGQRVNPQSRKTSAGRFPSLEQGEGRVRPRLHRRLLCSLVVSLLW